MTERTGGCLCGAVRYRAVGEPERVALCHCATCRKNTGSPYLAYAVFKAERVSIEGTLDSIRAPTIARNFCPLCGTLISLTYDDAAEVVDLMLGTFDEPPPFTPQYELWVEQREDWLEPVPGARQYAQSRS